MLLANQARPGSFLTISVVCRSSPPTGRSMPAWWPVQGPVVPPQPRPAASKTHRRSPARLLHRILKSRAVAGVVRRALHQRSRAAQPSRAGVLFQSEALFQAAAVLAAPAAAVLAPAAGRAS